ncbi:MAG: hypothetical protein KF715_12950 [Candidatus Didemnitutus sp.]|nr:hypothetical protein [Candidatus Didemnitutus sp.]
MDKTKQMKNEIVELTESELASVQGGASQASFWGAVAGAVTIGVLGAAAAVALPLLGAGVIATAAIGTAIAIDGAMAAYATETVLNANGVN